LLLGELTPTTGSIRLGANLQTIYFDQLRETINESQTVLENIGEGQETLLIHGKSRHIYSYLQDFLFTSEQARQRAQYLSGGERNRLMLARLFKRPSNVMVLDEPTNDLDAETLELLEELVCRYSGTVLVISHDRAFLNNVVTSTIAFDPDGAVREYDGGYDDYVRQSGKALTAATAKADPEPELKSPGTTTRKLSYLQQRELEALPDQIAEMELQQSLLHQKMADPEFFRQESSVIAEAKAALELLAVQIEESYQRWEKLEEPRGG